VDGFGLVRCAARWQERGLAWVRLRLPDGEWMSVEPRGSGHPAWGRCDGIGAEGAIVARLPAQDWLALREIPPLDDPPALPPGGGAALLNFAAELMQARAVPAVRYRGPYPTAHLFDALSRSFQCLPAPGDSAPEQGGAAVSRSRLRERFSADEWAAALRVAPADWSHPDVAWQPDPYAGSAPHPEVWMQWRRGVDAVRLRGRSFETPEPGVSLAGGCRVWPEGGGWAAGIVLLGRPWRTLARFAADGALVSYDPPQEPPAQPSAPLDAAWRTALADWTVVAAAPALAWALADLGSELEWAWSPLPWSVAEPGTAPRTVRVQAGLGEQFRQLAAQGQPPASLALMAVSDALANVQPILRRWAQQRLAASHVPPDPAALVNAGMAAQERARQRLAATLPALVARLASGEGWCDAEE
jgi:hypothetical protein